MLEQRDWNLLHAVLSELLLKLVHKHNSASHARYVAELIKD